MTGQAVLSFLAFFAANIVVASVVGIYAERLMSAWRRLRRLPANG